LEGSQKQPAVEIGGLGVFVFFQCPVLRKLEANGKGNLLDDDNTFFKEIGVDESLCFS
jgi:hypothetical protein